MEEEIREKITANFIQVKSTLQEKHEDVKDILFQQGILNLNDMEQIDGLKTVREKVDLIMKKVLSRNQSSTFLATLGKCGFSNLCQKIKATCVRSVSLEEHNTGQQISDLKRLVLEQDEKLDKMHKETQRCIKEQGEAMKNVVQEQLQLFAREISDRRENDVILTDEVRELKAMLETVQEDRDALQRQKIENYATHLKLQEDYKALGDSLRDKEKLAKTQQTKLLEQQNQLKRNEICIQDLQEQVDKLEEEKKTLAPQDDKHRHSELERKNSILQDSIQERKRIEKKLEDTNAENGKLKVSLGTFKKEIENLRKIRGKVMRT